MSILRRTAAVVVPLALVVGGVWYGIARHSVLVEATTPPACARPR